MNSDPQHQERVIRTAIELQATQIVRTLFGVVVIGIVLIVSLKEETDVGLLTTWVLLVCWLFVVRAVALRKILKRVRTAHFAELRRFQGTLIVTVITITLAFGSGYWWVAVPGTERAVSVITLLSCFYAIGSVVNSSIHFRSFVIGVTLNLGQGVLFFLGVGNEPHPELAITLLVVALLVISFGHQNARQFDESIRIRSHNVRLTKRLREENQAVETALSEARKANDDKNRFIAAASHDLRQPLHALNLFLTSLSLLINDDEATRVLRKIRETVDDMSEQFDSILDLSRFDAGAVLPNRTDFRIDLSLNGMVEQVKVDAQERHLGLNLVLDAIEVHSDRLLVERVVRNLLSNAIRYSNEGCITVKVSKQDNHAVVEIADTGLGISLEDQRRIFEDFVQLNNPARQRDRGVGFGLAIVRRIGALLNLDVKVESTEGVGSCFSFSLPLVQAVVADMSEPPVLPAIGGAMRPRPGLHIWVVEDNQKVGEALLLLFDQWQCSAAIVSNRNEVNMLRQATGRWPDLFLIDDMLCDSESGLDIAEWLLEYTDQERIVMVTGNTTPARLQQIRSRGFGVLLKPASANVIVEILNSVPELDTPRSAGTPSLQNSA